MKWFTGSIDEAVATSKLKKAVFVVFVEGKDDTSLRIAQAINTVDVSSRLEQESFVAIRLESGTEAYTFFAKIYHLVPVPSLFFIGEDGRPLEIVASDITAVELASKIDNVLMKAGKNNKHYSSNLIGAEQEATGSGDINIEATTSNINNIKSNPSTNLISSESNTIQAPSETAKDSLNTENKNNETLTENTEITHETKDMTTEEKLQRARNLIELQRQQRLEDEKKKDQEREIERRKTGRDVQKMRQKQQDLEIQQAYEERKREKAAETAAREKVRQQIAQDKLERKQKELELQQTQQTQRQKCQEQPKYNPAPSNTTVRIQFRLPSGNSHTGQFEPSNTLRALRTYVIDNITLPSPQFTMSTSFPRRELTSEEDDKTLVELELVPTAVILILPSKITTKVTKVAKITAASPSPAQNVGFLSRFMWSLFMPIIGIYNYIVDYFSGANRNADRRRDNSNSNFEPAGNTDRAITSNERNVTSGLFTRYMGNQGGTTVRAHGNIHRLHSDGDDNDENNTWNGNSTQQM